MDYYNNLDVEIKEVNGKITFTKPKIGQTIYFYSDCKSIPVIVCDFIDNIVICDNQGDEMAAKAVISGKVIRWIDVT